jgi:hypothetical protein
MSKFEETNHYQEIILRGTHISVAADVEWILLSILSSIFIGREVELENICFGKSLDKVTLYEKIGAVQMGLIRYHTAFFMQHEEDFKLLHRLRAIRNRFGHGKIDWVSEDNKEDLWITEATANGLDKKPYKKSALIKDLREYREAVMNLLNTIKLLFLEN